MRHVLPVGSLLLVVIAAGCASSPALRTESSSSAIRAAEEVGASEVPRASLHFSWPRRKWSVPKACRTGARKMRPHRSYCEPKLMLN